MRQPQPPRVPQQQSLFRVIPIDTIASPQGKEAGQASRPGPRRVSLRATHPDQDFLPFAETTGSAPSPSAKPAVECDAPVASIRSRCQALAVDLLFVLAAYCLFFGCLLPAIRPLPFDRTAMLLYGVAFALILVFYKLLECLFSDRSPGMRVAGLRLLHFHGRPATRRQRLQRMATGLLSLLPAGIGFWWALLDEEHLTFHDQISGTFPTPE